MEGVVVVVALILAFVIVAWLTARSEIRAIRAERAAHQHKHQNGHSGHHEKPH
jgi:hypothetical protein